MLSPVTVTGLGWFDENHDGLGIAHEIGIWDSAGNLLVSATVPNGTVGTLDVQYRTVSVSPLDLEVGAGYVVGGLNASNTGDRLAATVTFTIDPRLAFNHATSSDFTATFGEPTNNSVALNGFFGPMFEIGATDAVPEPGTVALAGISLLVLTALQRHRRPLS